MSDIQGALHIPRTKLITRLKEVRTEAETKRKEAAEAERKRRKEVLDQVSKLTTDQVANMLTHFRCTGDESLVKWLKDDVIENEKFKTIEPAATAVETSLDRTIRVFELASDEQIEVKPSDSIYSYL
jgi:hypothetical protein